MNLPYKSAAQAARDALAASPETRPGKIKVYFNNGNTAIFNRRDATFTKDGTVFTLDDAQDGEPVSFSAILDAGVLVNWDNVSWVRTYEERGDED